jgi:uncharacterized membrane protein YozB (DUF420 family)
MPSYGSKSRRTKCGGEIVNLGEVLPHTNALLNATSGVLLLCGFVAIRRGREDRHRRLMLSAFGCSVLFLISYLTRYALTGDHRYPGEGWDRTFYLVLLATHVSLATLVPFLAGRTLYLGLKTRGSPARREQHRRWARVTFPIWMYVSVTGIIVYWMLYQ